MLFAIILWAIGLLGLVPFTIFLFMVKGLSASTFLFVLLPVFWMFGYWGVVGPLVSILKMRRIVCALEMMKTNDRLLDMIRQNVNEEDVVGYLSREINIPKFAARHFHSFLLEKFQSTRLASKHTGLIP